ncbi:recombinase family protein [Shewanella sp. A32]|uniref:recombinase family protein n=1 Tax=Shewanella sp. A32 TaxID=3031327 RepID=UPI0023BA3391|nr:recombinase family protein [Shewanella sp. A32]MDF0535026.1 recombinase family protein [Shewanella sp. A32]
MQTLGYKRVSTVDQNTARQLDGMKLDKEFVDHCSGATTERPALKELINHSREGDVILVHSIDRMARNLSDLLSLISGFTERGITIKFVKEGWEFTANQSNPMQDLMLSVMGAVAQFERALIKERQREGIEKAKARNVYKGRKQSVDREEVLKLHQQGVKKAQIAKQLGVGRTSVYRVLEETGL